jgi:hypothetical protein
MYMSGRGNDFTSISLITGLTFGNVPTEWHFHFSSQYFQISSNIRQTLTSNIKFKLQSESHDDKDNTVHKC